MTPRWCTFRSRAVQADSGWFGVGMKLFGRARRISRGVRGLPGLSSVSFAPELAGNWRGRGHFGIPAGPGGETVPNLKGNRLLLPLGFGRWDWWFAVPEAWIDVVTMEDLDDVAADFRPRPRRAAGRRHQIHQPHPPLLRRPRHRRLPDRREPRRHRRRARDRRRRPDRRHHHDRRDAPRQRPQDPRRRRDPPLRGEPRRESHHRLDRPPAGGARRAPRPSRPEGGKAGPEAAVCVSDYPAGRRHACPGSPTTPASLWRWRRWRGRGWGGCRGWGGWRGLFRTRENHEHLRPVVERQHRFLGRTVQPARHHGPRGLDCRAVRAGRRGRPSLRLPEKAYLSAGEGGGTNRPVGKRCGEVAGAGSCRAPLALDGDGGLGLAEGGIDERKADQQHRRSPHQGKRPLPIAF